MNANDRGRAILLFAWVLALSACNPLPDTSELEGDIAAIELRIAEGEHCLEQGAAGLLGALKAMELRYLENTHAALELKRHSMIQFINLDFSIENDTAVPLSDSQLERLQNEISDTRAKLSAAESESARYTGGLIKSMIEVQVATHRATIAGLEMKQLLGKWGIPVLDVQPNTGGEEMNYADDEAL